MKLEIKHLAPYLPYGLKVQTTRKYKETLHRLSEYVVITREAHQKSYAYNVIKPILHPLSGLHINGEILTPEYLHGCPYSYVEMLFSNHYDVFGLIDKGLAININEINSVEA